MGNRITGNVTGIRPSYYKYNSKSKKWYKFCAFCSNWHTEEGFYKRKGMWTICKTYSKLYYDKYFEDDKPEFIVDESFISKNLANPKINPEYQILKKEKKFEFKNILKTLLSEHELNLLINLKGLFGVKPTPFKNLCTLLNIPLKLIIMTWNNIKSKLASSDILKQFYLYN